MKTMFKPCIMFLVGVFCLTLNSCAQNSKTVPPSTAKDYVPARTIAPTSSMDFVPAAEKTIHAVVHIQTEMERKSSSWDNFFDNDFFDQFFNFRAPQRNMAPVIATGSGVILSKDGYIVTNNHVIDGAQKITVTLNDKKEYEATLIGADPSTDLAVIKVEGKNLPYLEFGNSDLVKIGEWVLAVGNPFNLTSTVTAGIVSAKARNLNILGDQSSIESFIQTDAAVNRGNSGGALVNIVGELIGINSAIASNTGYYAGYSFAVPANIAKKVVKDLIQYGKVQRAYLGVSFSEIDHKKADELKLDEVKGVYIATVEKGGAADKAGIQKEDIILEIGKLPTNSVSELKEVVAQHSPGDKVTVKILRNKKVIYLDVEFLSKLGNKEVVKKDDTDVNALLGGSFETLSKKECESFGISGGIRLVSIQDGVLKRSGIKEGYVITSVNKKSVHSLQDLNQILSDDQTGYVALEGFYKNTNYRYFYTIPLQ